MNFLSKWARLAAINEVKINVKLMPAASIYYRGQMLRIDITEDGRSSLEDLNAQHKGDRNVVAALARADRLIQRFAEMGRLRSGEEFKQEVPSENGYPAFWAIRPIPVRIYGWYLAGKVFVISHCICKRRDRLESSDVERMRTNSRSYVNPKGE